MGSRGGPSCKQALWQPHKGSPRIANGQSLLGLRHPAARAGRHKAPILQGAFGPPLAPLLLIPMCGTLERTAPLPAIAQAWWPSPIGLLSTRRELACCPPPMQTGSPVCPRHSPHQAPSAHGLQKICPVQGNTSPPQARGKKTKKTKESILPKQCLHKSLSFSFFLEVV